MQHRPNPHGATGYAGKKLIQQAADCAAGKGPPPPELEIWWKCQRFGCLPEAGGYLDQDAALMDRAVICEDVYHLVKKWRGMKQKDFTKLTDAERHLYKWLHQGKVIF